MQNWSEHFGVIQSIQAMDRRMTPSFVDIAEIPLAEAGGDGSFEWRHPAFPRD
jgi:hypothetical protein